MKKKKFGKSKNLIQEENNTKNKEKDVIQSIGSFNDFLIMERKDKIPESQLQNQNNESDDNFLKDFIIMQRRPKQDKSRFTELFKEISEKEKEKDKIEKKEEPKIEISPNININQNNPPPPNNRFESYDPFPNINNNNNNNFYQNNLLKKNLNFGEYEKTFNNNFSNPNSRLPSAFGFKGHGIGIPISGRSTNANTNNKTSSFASIESNMFNFPNNANMNIIYNNNNNNINSNNNINNNLNINNNNIGYNNNIINNSNNINNNIINYNNSNINSINYIEKEFEPNVSIKKILSLEDQRSTMMIKNIPNKFTREKLLEIIDKNFNGTYDLFILPKDGNKNRNFGYAFINFISSYSIPYFYFVFNGKKWVDTNSNKICEITYSKIQGRSELISHYPNKIIYFNDKLDVKNGNKFFIPKDYLDLFKQLFPNHPIEENNLGFITKIPFIF